MGGYQRENMLMESSMALSISAAFILERSLADDDVCELCIARVFSLSNILRDAIN